MPPSRNDLLISPDALSEALGAASLRVFDAAVCFVRDEAGYRVEAGRERYLEGHIPGAAHLDLVDALADTTSEHDFTLPDIAALAAAIGEAGIGNDSDVVVYSSDHMMWATRAWWLLHYAGHSKVRVLDGGLDAWRAAGLPIATGGATYPATKFVGAAKADRFAPIDEVERAAADGACVVNTLTAEMYEGTGDFDYGRRGHIPGSRHLFYDAVLEDGAFLENDALRGTLGEAGMLEGGRVITYCGGGIAATVQAFACLLVGAEDVAVYDGSMSEWVRAGKPLRTGPTP